MSIHALNITPSAASASAPAHMLLQCYGNMNHSRHQIGIFHSHRFRSTRPYHIRMPSTFSRIFRFIFASFSQAARQKGTSIAYCLSHLICCAFPFIQIDNLKLCHVSDERRDEG